MYYFPVNRELTKEEKLELACDNWLQAEYEFQKGVQEQLEYWRKDREKKKIMEQEDKEANKALDEWIKKLETAKLNSK